MKKLENKVAVVTGGNSGLGFEAAKQLKADGARVIIAGRSPEKVKQAATELEVEGIAADVSDITQIDQLVSEVGKLTEGVDVLYVNAGVFYLEPVGSISENVFDQEMDVNFKGAVFTVEKFLPILNEGASVINLSSVAAHTATANLAIYSASKAALNAYTKTASIELAPRKIRVNSISPGPIDTPIFNKLGLPNEHVEAIKNRNREQIPLKRMGTPNDIAQMVSFLASDNSSFITGAEFIIDGGASLKS